MKRIFSLRNLALGGIVLASCIVPLTALAARGNGGRGQDGAGGRIRAVLEKLDLSSEQQAKIKEYAQASRPALRQARDQVRADRSTLKVLMDSPNPDPTALGNATLKLKASRQAMRGEMSKLRDATESVMTPEQKAKFEAYLDAFRSQRQGRRGGMQ
jgi:periplasmic protein CpxP/Spy